ncbi:MAG: thiamine ABC transporter substrate binding subunit [bacterium]
MHARIPASPTALPSLLFSLILVLAATPASAAQPTLNVYTYDSFASKWGPGPAIKERFEARCDCILNYVAVDGSTGILSRVLLEGATSRADVVLGLDNSLLAEARATGLLAPHGVALEQLDLPFAWDDATFLPFDYGYFAFIHNRDQLPDPPRSFRQLVADDSLRIIIQDPRSSTPGLGLVLWVKALYGDDAFAVWRALADNIVTVTRGWSEAYGLFLDGEADLVLSYTTSPAYHIIAEGKRQYRAAAFSEGHGMQIEVAARLARAPNPALARRFMAFIASDAFQSAIPTGNWMYPVREIEGGLPAAFDQLVQPTAKLLIDPQRIAANRAAWVDEFSQALSE